MCNEMGDLKLDRETIGKRVGGGGCGCLIVNQIVYRKKTAHDSQDCRQWGEERGCL